MNEREENIITNAQKDLFLCARKNINKIMITLFVFNIIETVITLFCSKLVTALAFSTPFVVTLVLSVLISLSMLTVIMLLYYGLSVMTLRMVRREFVTIGFLFMGFRKWRSVTKYAFFFAVFLLVVFSALIALLFFVTPVYKIFNQVGLMVGSAIMVLFFLSALVLCLFPWTFVWHLLANEPEKQKCVFKRNFALLKGRKKLFWKIFLRTMGKKIVGILIIWAFMFFFTQASLKSQSAPLSLLSSFFSFFYMYQLYATQALAFLLLPIIYNLFLKDSVERQVDLVEIKYALPDNSGDAN